MQDARAASREDEVHLEHLVLAKNTQESPGSGLHRDRVRAGHLSKHQASEVSSRQSGCSLGTPDQCSSSVPQEGRRPPPARTAARICGGKKEVTLGSFSICLMLSLHQSQVIPTIPRKKHFAYVDFWLSASSWISSPLGFTVNMRLSGSPTCL